MMSACGLCHGLATKNSRNGTRLFLEFTPAELRQSALVDGCQTCAMILMGILLMQKTAWTFATDVSRVYGYGLSTQTDTLYFDLYFIQERPKLVLEFFWPYQLGERLTRL